MRKASKLSCLVLALAVAAGLPLNESLAQDPGQPDTMWADCGSNKAVHDTGGWVAYTIYLKTDNQAAGTDIAGLQLPLYISRSNLSAAGRMDTTVNLVFAKSVFKDSADILSVDADSVKLNGPLEIGAAQFSGGPMNGTFIIAQIWLHLEDSTSITIDTLTHNGNGLLLVTSQAVGYVPKWRKATCSVCVHSSPAGDANCNGSVTLSDVIYLVNYLFKGWSIPCCKALSDINCNGTITLSDVITLVNYIFRGVTPPHYCP